jgi:hypothetical protein
VKKVPVKLSKIISIECIKLGIPTILINQAYYGDTFNKLIQSIEQSAVILFDEFEKVYKEEEQESVLTLLDGVYPSKKLFVLTCNNKWRIDTNMKNRPGRIFYMLEYVGLEESFIREYCQDHIKNQEYIDQVCIISNMFAIFNFDMLKALVEEMNRYNESPQEAIKLLNAKPEYGSNHQYDIQIRIDGKLIDKKDYSPHKYNGNPLDPKYLAVDITESKVFKTKTNVVKNSSAPVCSKDTDDGDVVEFKFEQDTLIRFDIKTNQYVYKIDNIECLLTKVITKSFHPFAF